MFPCICKYAPDERIKGIFAFAERLPTSATLIVPSSPLRIKRNTALRQDWKIPQMPFQLFGQCHKRAEHCPALKATSHNRAQGMCAARWRMWTMHLSESGASVSKALSATSAVLSARQRFHWTPHCKHASSEVVNLLTALIQMQMQGYLVNFAESKKCFYQENIILQPFFNAFTFW